MRLNKPHPLRSSISIIIIWSMLCQPLLFASTTKTWMVAAAIDFAKGKLKNANILASGQLAPGMGAKQIKLKEISIWATAFAADGTAYVGTGNNGLVFRVDKKGVHQAFATGEAVVTSLVWARGTLYAGTMPNGKIFAWRPRSKPRLVADLDTPYIWDMIFHRKLKELIVGTGPDGKVMSVTPGGKSKVFYDSGESHILSLVEGNKGEIFAGTSTRGILFHFDPTGKVKETWDLDDNEVRALSFYNGSLYIGANKIKSYEADLYFMNEKGMLQDRSQFARLLAARIQQLGQGDEAVDKSFQELFDTNIYRLTPTHDLHRILQIPKRYVCDIGVDEQGVIYAATADEGELWAASEPNLGWVMMDLKEAQILSLGMYHGQLRQLATANAAAIYQTSNIDASAASFTSEVKDTGFSSTWGQIQWKSTGPIQVTTRTGNHEIPDSTWSDWSEPLTKSGSRVNSPKARFIQFRINWPKNSDAKVDWIRLAYINENQRPQIKNLVTARLQDAMPATKGIPSSSNRSSDDDDDYRQQQINKARNKVLIQWQANDPDGDNLIYWIYYRREGDKEWVIINPKKPVSRRLGYFNLHNVAEMKTRSNRSRRRYYMEDESQSRSSFEWKTGNVMDGWYMIKVVASDENDNAVNSKKVWLETGPILIDSRKPKIAELEPTGEMKWDGRAKDDTSYIARIEYNLDGERWKILTPRDGIYDNQEERFSIELRNVMPGEHVLTVRAFDEGGNIGMRQVGFTRKAGK